MSIKTKTKVQKKGRGSMEGCQIFTDFKNILLWDVTPCIDILYKSTALTFRVGE